MTSDWGDSKEQNERSYPNPVVQFLGMGLTAMLLVAFEDGKLHWHEREVLVESMRTLGDQVTVQQALKFLDDTAHMLQNYPKDNWAELFNPDAISSEMKVMILGMCMRVAFSDGHLSITESDLIHNIADWIKIDSHNRRLWKQKVREALNESMERGIKFTGIENLYRDKSENVIAENRASNSFDIANSAYAAGEMKKCVDLLHAAAADGDAPCQTFLGALYQEGDAGLERDTWRAVKLFEQATDQYNLMGTFLLARTYYLGVGVKKDKKKGIRLFKRAAFMNSPEAQATLAQIYGKPWNARVGGAWLLVAAHNGHVEAMKYVEQRGEPSDRMKALATKLIEIIQGLQLLTGLDPDLALARLAELENEDIS